MKGGTFVGFGCEKSNGDCKYDLPQLHLGLGWSWTCFFRVFQSYGFRFWSEFHHHSCHHRLLSFHKKKKKKKKETQQQQDIFVLVLYLAFLAWTMFILVRYSSAFTSCPRGPLLPLVFSILSTISLGHSYILLDPRLLDFTALQPTLFFLLDRQTSLRTASFIKSLFF